MKEEAWLTPEEQALDAVGGTSTVGSTTRPRSASRMANLSAVPATSGATDRPRAADDDTTMPSSGTTLETPTSTASGAAPGKSEPGSTSPTSGPSETPSTPSRRRFSKPRNVKEFAALANTVAVDILNGDIDLDTARAFSSVARTVAQSVSAMTVRSRFLKTAPDLDFPDPEEET